MRHKRKPAYQLHRASGQAKVRIDGRDHYLGLFGSQASRDRYDKLIVEWFASRDPTQLSLTIDDVALRYLRFAESYYVKSGELTSEIPAIRSALRPLIRLFGNTPAHAFGPLRLKQVRERMIEGGWARTTVNRGVDRIRRMFRWAAENELVPGAVCAALATVAGLRKGRSTARETDPVRPVDERVVNQTLPFLSPVVADMVRLQRLTGMRPGEVCSIRPCELNRDDEIWEYRPTSHKIEHRDRSRTIFIGPRAQVILRPYLDRPQECYCFSPSESEQVRRQRMHENRMTPMTVGNFPGSNRKVSPRRSPRHRFSKDSYSRAITRACELAFGMPAELRKPDNACDKAVLLTLRQQASDWRARHCWSPNQLRHSAATEIRRRFGLEAAGATLGHSELDVTQLYAERNATLAITVARALG